MCETSQERKTGIFLVKKGKLLSNLSKFLRSEVTHWEAGSWWPTSLKMSPSHHLVGHGGKPVHQSTGRGRKLLRSFTWLQHCCRSSHFCCRLNYHSKEHPENSSQEPGNRQPGSQEYKDRISAFSFIKKTRFNEEIIGRKYLFFPFMAPSTPHITYPYLHSPNS